MRGLGRSRSQRGAALCSYRLLKTRGRYLSQLAIGQPLRKVQSGVISGCKSPGCDLLTRFVVFDAMHTGLIGLSTLLIPVWMRRKAGSSRRRLSTRMSSGQRSRRCNSSASSSVAERCPLGSPHPSLAARARVLQAGPHHPQPSPTAGSAVGAGSESCADV
jgi:hypothetical protein